MNLVQRILVAVDFGPRTEELLDAASAAARKFGSQVVLLHVLPVSEASTREGRRMLKMAREGAAARLRDLRLRLAGEGVSAAEGIVAEGIPFDQIIRHGEDLDVNVVMVGTNEAGEPSPGTTAERVCRKSNKPVWLVATGVPPAPQRILCPVDFSPASRRALTNGLHLARHLDARLVVLHVIGPVGGYGSLAAADGRVDEHHREAERLRFNAFLGEFDFHGIERESVLVEGSPHEQIVAEAARHGADLVVMGSVGATGLSRILMGGVAIKVARRLPCSLILFKAEDAIRLRLDEELADLATHYRQGCDLLENGFLEEARRQFGHCISTSDMFLPAWEGLALVYERLGQNERAESCRQTAGQIEEMLTWRRAGEEIRVRHAVWSGSRGPSGSP